MSDEAVLAGTSLARDFGRARWFGASKAVHAVDGVTIDVKGGETLAIVGESGCGKTTLGRLMLGLIRPTSGEVSYQGRPIDGLRGAGFRQFRRDVQVVFQDPSASLNPRKRVWQIIASAMQAHGLATRQNAVRKAVDQLELVGLAPGQTFAHRYPHQLSGGQQQRVALARAFSVQPRIIVADEPLSSLDLSIQAQVLDLMSRLQKETGAGYLLITHDLNVANIFADRVAVMYLGRVVETGPSWQVFADPRHPYTKALLDARLVASPRRRREQGDTTLQGEPPSPQWVPGGCRFHPRCPYAQPVCQETEPQLAPDTRPGTATACHFSTGLPERPGPTRNETTCTGRSTAPGGSSVDEATRPTAHQRTAIPFIGQ